MGLVKIVSQLQNYGYVSYGVPSNSLVSRAYCLPNLNALKEKFLEIIPTYMGTARHELNPHFRMLLFRRRVFKMGSTSFLIGLYTAQARKALWLAIDMVYLAVARKRKVLFIADSETDDLLELTAVNCMLYDTNLQPFISKLSDISFYYNSRPRTLLPPLSHQEQYFDLVVICLKDYSRVNRTTFQHYARFTLGFCGQNVRPDLFDYYVPAMGTYEASASLVRDVAVLGHLARSTS